MVEAILKPLEEIPDWAKPKPSVSKSRRYAEKVFEKLENFEGNVLEIGIPKGYSLIGVHACLGQLAKDNDEMDFIFRRNGKTEATKLVAFRKKEE